MFRTACYSLIFVLILGAGLPLHPQDARGTILGRVTDQSGALLPNVEIRVAGDATGAVVTARSNESGNYTVPFLIPGPYTLTAEAAGFKKFQRGGIELRVSDALEINIQMTVGDVSESIEVSASAQVLDTASVALGQVIDSRRTEELPLQAGNAFELALLAPGTTNDSNLRIRKAAFAQAPSQFSTDGNTSYSNEFTIDGVPNSAPATNMPQVAFNPPQSSVAEFRVQTVTYDASLGHTPGSVVNVSTASGANRLRGEAHHWFQNAALDAPDLFQNRSGQKKPVYQDNRYGVSFGGPVYLPKLYGGRNRTFFFYTWEENLWGTPSNFIGTVPDNNLRAGDFSGLLTLGASYQIYDPATAQPAVGGRVTRQPFPDNRIPANRIDAVARNMMQYWPQPNVPGTRDGRSNYSTPQKATQSYDVHLARIDHNFSQNHRVYVRMNGDWWHNDRANRYNNISTAIVNERTSKGLAFDDVLVLGPASVLNIRYGVVHRQFSEYRGSRGIDLRKLGFSDALVSRLDSNNVTFPQVTFSAYTGFGNMNQGDGKDASMVHSLTANLTTLRGNHNLRYGGETRVYREFNTDLSQDVAPVLNFTAQYTRGPADNATDPAIGGDLAAFLLGIPGGNIRRTASYAEQNTFFALYVHDDWKVARNLTVNVGLRWEMESPLTERYDRSVKSFDFDVTSPIEAQARANYARNPIAELPIERFRTRGGMTFAGGVNGRGLWRGEKNNFMPRVAFAWQPGARTVVRSGYGLFFETIGANRSAVNQAGYTRSTPIQASLDNGLSFVATTANPFPSGILEPVGAAGGLATNLGQAAGGFPAKRLQPYAQRWSLGIQHEVTSGLLVEATYVGNRGTRLDISRGLNAVPAQYLSTSPERDQPAINFLTANFANPFFGVVPVATANIQRQALLRPYPHFNGVSMDEPTGYSWYHSMQTRVERRFSRGFTAGISYTFSKLMEATEFLNATDAMPYETISSGDHPHRLALSGIWELPFGKGRKFAAGGPGWADHVIGGWQLNLVAARQAGAPLEWGNVIFRGNIQDIALPKGGRSVDRWFNTDAGFERNSQRQLANNIRTFPLRFAGIRGDGQARWDLSALKNFRLREPVTLQFRAECFNAWNHPNLNNPNLAPANSAFGTINGQSPTPRQFQLALKLKF